MIASLRGRVASTRPGALVLDVGGVGYLVHATPSAVRKGDSADEITVETYLHVREDVLQLYGFADRSERELFVQLLAVSGIGPKVALAIVSGSPVAELRRAIVRGDSARFQAIPGIGKKTAERIVLELREKLDIIAGPSAIAPGAPKAKPGFTANEEDVISALMNIGANRGSAEAAVMKAKSETKAEDFESLFRVALRLLR